MYEVLRRTHEPTRYLIRPSRNMKTERAWTRIGVTEELSTALHHVASSAWFIKQSHYRIEVQT